jgi:heme oxygenase
MQVAGSRRLHFTAVVEDRCGTPQSRERAATMARETFLALESWLCQEIS